ncbi:hypothetical protein RIF29_28642 [Crotalaria pallida]|uniref:Epidermal patterning factor-like protein n=1 Tax=Crotalaria pallida TaxID=3830 RepID=A0AAN9HZJ9_CROPI
MTEANTFFHCVNFNFIGEEAMKSEHCTVYFKGNIAQLCTTHLKVSSSFSIIKFHTTHTLKCFIDSSLMASPAGRSYPLHQLKVATVVFIFFLSILPHKSGGSLVFKTSESLKEREMMIGSQPPACIKRCMNCMPCMPTLVVPNYQKWKAYEVLSHGEENDDTYYPLSWKCKCGDKLFQP